MANKTTMLDLEKTAQAAALTAVGLAEFKKDNLLQEAFNAAGHDPLDYPEWKRLFLQRVTDYTAAQANLAPSAKVAPAA